MSAVLVTLALACGCTEAIVDGASGLLVCSADVCRGRWWCECADPDDPRMCGHVDVLLLEMDGDRR